jgi:hypothetical protein
VLITRIPYHLRERHLVHRPPDTCDVAVGALCRAWNALTAERIRSPASYPEQVRAQGERYGTL